MNTGEDAVLDAFEALYTSAAAKNADALTALFADEPDITFWGSEEAEKALGPSAVREFMRKLSSSPTTFEFRWDERRVHIEGDAAWVNATGECEWAAPGRDGGVLPYRVTGLFIRREDRWLWHTHHGSEPHAD